MKPEPLRPRPIKINDFWYWEDESGSLTAMTTTEVAILNGWRKR